MMITIETILFGAAILLLMGILASKTSEKLGVPVLLFFLLIGIIAGSDGLNVIYFDDAWLAQAIGIIALAFILFDGGISTKWKSVRSVVEDGALLSTLGVLLTAIILGVFSAYVLKLPLLYGLLLGSIVSSTDAAAVFAVLRSKRVSLKGRLKPLLELESGSNDPMAVFLTISVIYLIANPQSSLTDVIPIFFSQLIIGAFAGYGMAKVSLGLINRLRLEYEGLYPVFTVSTVLFTYGLTALLGGSGILAVYILGLIFGNSKFIHKTSIKYFHDGLAWMMQIIMFLTMGLLVFPSQLIPIMPAGILISLFLMFIARPVSVFVMMVLSKFGFREKLLISWVGLRGSVPIILATFPLIAGVDHAHTIFNLVFFIVVVSVLLQGWSIPYIARLLKLDEPETTILTCAREQVHVGDMNSEILEIDILEDSAAANKAVMDLDLPDGVLITTVKRGNEVIIPRGSTILEANDTITVLANKMQRKQICPIFGLKFED
ncbi:potassium/proton antiporter [Methanocella arvoryzae]|uniref:Na(+)/H(+) antiporter n=1 Tax=Methanocella arvoryzae (strain DSM 22066 / NBRC 105507 / MRE50) TaxID=351160 RepID=Q0W0D4_METAR|nr:potassium/proton antiporter [Methanocella arvoryzae]CAJ38159.1 putative Na(+)/H(+) antiporter [Methanocella arvoryzae MRE50]